MGKVIDLSGVSVRPEQRRSCGTHSLPTAAVDLRLLSEAPGLDAHFCPFVPPLDQELRGECDALCHAPVRNAVDFEDSVSFLQPRIVPRTAMEESQQSDA